MAETLILDSEAINSLAHVRERGTLADRARAILTVAYEHGALVRVPAPVLAEVCRSPRFDAAIHHVLNARGIGVAVLTRSIAERAGHLLARLKLSSAHSVDAFVVATAAECGHAIIATSDPVDIRRLAAAFRQIRVLVI